MQEKNLYEDSLIIITDDSITLKNYYFPSLKEKKIPFEAIERIETRKPTIWTGKWRIHGTGNFKTWFPLDSSRYKRDMIFFIFCFKKWVVSGFTAEDSFAVEKLFKEKGLLKI